MKKTNSNEISGYYDQAYFDKFRNKSWYKKLLLDRIDRKEPVMSFLNRIYKKSNQPTLLDVGCGVGWFLRAAEKKFVCTGIDVAKDALKMAREVAPKSKFKLQSIYSLDDFADESFDVVTCFDTLEHVVGHEYIFNEFFRILKSDGVLVISAPNADSISRSLKWRDWFGFKDPSHLWHFSAQLWGQRLSDYGFVPMRTWLNGMMDPPYWPNLPDVFQEWLIKYPTQIWAMWGLPLPKWAGETFFMVLVKNPGWKSSYKQQQQRLLADARKK